MSPRDFIQRWATLYHTVERHVREHQAVCAFKAGVRYRDLYLKFGRTGDISMSKMMEIATRYANGEEEDRIRSGKHKAMMEMEMGQHSAEAKLIAPQRSRSCNQCQVQGQREGSVHPQEEAVQ
ncbi:hypothetical protein ZWY2020_036517 [Hordeum vulgare]|nr:hypothetical protein ZWY2020_036517 [Hordeum vulgare]